MNFRPEAKPADFRIDITPLVDVVFQLLIFFALTMSFITQETLEVELPKADTSAIAKEPKKVLLLTVTNDGKVTQDGTPLDDAQLKGLFQRAVRMHKEPTLLLRADKNVKHGNVVRVMDLALQQRLTRLAIATKKE